MLYLPLWLYSVRERDYKFGKREEKIFMTFKITSGVLLYFVNVFHQLKFKVIVFKTLLFILIVSLLSAHIWDAYLKIQYHHHR